MNKPLIYFKPSGELDVNQDILNNIAHNYYINNRYYDGNSHFYNDITQFIIDTYKSAFVEGVNAVKQKLNIH